MSEPVAVGIDIGGSKIAFAVLHKDGTMVDATQIPIRKQQTAAETISEIAIQVELLTSKSRAPLAGIGIGCPGQVDSKTGVVKNAVNLGWHDVNLAEEIKARLPLKAPVLVKKDADANLLGEYLYGPAQGFADVMFLCIGSGLGCSIISDHRLVEGATGTAGGIGHIRLEDNDELCTCGLHGCAESLISGPGLVTRTRRLLEKAPQESSLKTVQTLTPQIILESDISGDPIANQAMDDLSRALGQVLAMCVAIVNPELIVIGGGLGVVAFDRIIPPAVEEMKKQSLPHTYENLQILPAGLQSSAVGAASLVWNNLSDYAKGGGEAISH